VEDGADGLLICGYEPDLCQSTKQALLLLAEKHNRKTQVEALGGDLSKETDCRAVMSFVEETWGRLDGLVNAAALSTRGKINFKPPFLD